MSGRALLNPKAADALAKLCGMFGSAHDGERAAAARLADEFVRQKLGLTWPDVIFVTPECQRALRGQLQEAVVVITRRNPRQQRGECEMINLETACRAHLEHLEFRDGPHWTFVDPKNSHIVSPAFGSCEDAEAWQAPYLEEQAAKRRAAEEGAL